MFRLTHATGHLYFINLLSMGFAADAAVAANRHFKRLGEFGYMLGVLVCLARLRRRAFPLRADEDKELDRRRCLFLSFNNSKFTGGKMMIAPQARTDDGLIEYVRWGPVGRVQLVRNFPTLFDGTHINHPQASRRAVRRIDFSLDAPVDVMVDGEVLTLDCRHIDVLPGAAGRAGMTAARGLESPGIGEKQVRSLALWAASCAFFFTVVPVLILVGIFVDPRKNDRPQRWMSRWTVRLAGGKVEVRKSPGFDPNRTCFLVSNHVNLFDAFVLYGAVPNFFRGLEPESHFPHSRVRMADETFLAMCSCRTSIAPRT